MEWAALMVFVLFGDVLIHLRVQGRDQLLLVPFGVDDADSNGRALALSIDLAGYVLTDASATLRQNG